MEDPGFEGGWDHDSVVVQGETIIDSSLLHSQYGCSSIGSSALVAGKEDPRFMSTTIYVSILAPISEEVSWQLRIEQSYTFFNFFCNYFLGPLKHIIGLLIPNPRF